MSSKTAIIILLVLFGFGGVWLYSQKIVPVLIKEETVAGLNQRILNGGVFITPFEVVSDSRCPVDVVCVWAGEVSLKVRLERGIASKEVILKQQTPFIFEGTKISLIDVTPVNNSKKSINDEDYRFTFLVTLLNESDKSNLIRVETPHPNQIIQSPLIIKGEARGYWFFEASFPVVLTNWDGLIIAQGIATAQEEWMTEEFVPFEAMLKFIVDKNAYSNKGFLILRKDNPSGLPEHDDALEIPIVFAVITDNAPVSPGTCTEEAKLCPDGSAVGRTGPNCEFIKCPTVDPIGRQCNGPGDTSCPAGFECIQSCGPPVQRGDDPPPQYFCQLKGYIQTCPICLAKNTLINTPLGGVPVQNLQKGTPVWTVNNFGKRVIGTVIETSKTLVPPDHKMVELVLLDGHTLLVSPGHPTVGGYTVGDINVGDVYDNVQVISSNRVLYGDEYTYDILVSGETGFYFANDILFDSTLR